jgi:glutamate N-acetyltransferase/amino-acid N-acetyltransferase
VEKIKSGIGILFQKFSPDGLWDFASAITTTDRFPKVAEVEVSGKIGGKVVGIGKGAGMISPSLATMLVFLITDLGPPRRILRSSLKRAVEDTVGAIVVDGDQSTNDLVALFATGKRNPPWAKGMEEPFFHAVHEVLLQIGKQIVQDGEGATKLVEIVVEGGSRNHISRKVAQMIATSLLVKTALYGEDPNWGRIAARVGSCGLPLREEDLEIYFGEIPLFKKGKPPSEEILKEARHYLKRSEITVRVRFPGKGKARVFTCDIGVPYVELNAHYRT